MALDTRDKRSAAIHVTLPWRGMFPEPDGTIDIEDMKQIARIARELVAPPGAEFPGGFRVGAPIAADAIGPVIRRRVELDAPVRRRRIGAPL